MTELQIKISMVKYLIEKYKDFVIASEMPFQFGERRADLAMLHNGNLSAFEIKSARDTLLRLEYQIDSYKKFFDFCFVVCESSNLSAVRDTISKDIGILLVENNCISHVRQSRRFKRHDKVILSSALSVQKLKILANKNKLRSKYELCLDVARSFTLDALRDLSRQDFEKKYAIASRLMRQETTSHLNPDDIYTITKKPPSNLKRRSIP